MKTVHAVRWAAFLMMLLASADAAEVELMVGRLRDELQAKCGRCGQTGPTVPIAPVVFRARPTGGVTVPPGPANTSLGEIVPPVRPASTRAVREEFALDSAGPAVGAVPTR
jgi:hypothetical protein